MRVKTITIKNGTRLNFANRFPFTETMNDFKLCFSKKALPVKCGKRFYNVSSAPFVYFYQAH